MKALIYEAPRVVRLREVEKPSPGAGEVLLQVHACGICGSELEGYLGLMSRRRVPPLIMGHEFCGTVVEVGPEVEDSLLGTRVAVHPVIPCWECETCESGGANACPNRILISMHRPGALAEYVAVPHRNLFPLPPHLSDVQAALVEPVANAVHIVGVGQPQPLGTVALFGAGTIGLFTLQVARLAGALEVFVIDTNPARLELAQRLGATATVNPQETEVRPRIKDLTQGRGADTVIDAVGRGVTKAQALTLARQQGQVILVGLCEDLCELSTYEIILRELRIYGSYCYRRREFAQAIRLLAEGALETSSWVEVRPLTEGPQAFEDLVEQPAEHIKIILQP
ncbi:MAG TPA: galactitol-1-phosphate 5-dehydrogenase [Armatimonadetes bacterium]|nr:galactitol-1-phosphate 5-dehydrogenase [Armatimonadota bacterium]